MGAYDSVGFDPGTFNDVRWKPIGQDIFGGDGTAPDYGGTSHGYFGNGGENLLNKDYGTAWEDFSKSSGNWGGKSGYDWGSVFSGLFEKAAKNAMSNRNAGGGYDFPFGGKGMGGTNVSDLGGGNKLVTQGPDFSPMYIPGQKAQGFGGALGTLAGIGASFIPGLGPGIAAAMPSIGGNIGSMFG
jgi:hypothetical protein